MDTSIVDEAQVRTEILDSLGIAHLSEEAQQEVVAAAGGPILQSVTLALIEAMPEEAKGEFRMALEAGDGGKVQQLITIHVPDSTAFIAEEVRKAAAEFKQLFQAASQG